MNFHNLHTVNFKTNDRNVQKSNSSFQKHPLNILYKLKKLEGKKSRERSHIGVKQGSHKLNISRSRILGKTQSSFWIQNLQRPFSSSKNKHNALNIGVPQRKAKNNSYHRRKQPNVNVLYTRRQSNKASISKQRNVNHGLRNSFRSPCSIFSSIQKRDGRINPYLISCSLDNKSSFQISKKKKGHSKSFGRNSLPFSDSHVIKRKSSVRVDFMPYIPKSRKVANSAQRHRFPKLSPYRIFSKSESYVAVNTGMLDACMPLKCDTTAKTTCGLETKPPKKSSRSQTKLTIIKYILFVFTVIAWSPCIVVALWVWLITYPLRAKIDENELKSDSPKKCVQRQVNKKRFNNNRLLCSLKADTTKLSSLVFAQLNAMYSSFPYLKQNTLNEVFAKPDSGDKKCKDSFENVSKYKVFKRIQLEDHPHICLDRLPNITKEDVNKNSHKTSNVTEQPLRTHGKTKTEVKETVFKNRDKSKYLDTGVATLLDLHAPLRSPLIYFTGNNNENTYNTDHLRPKDSASADCFHESNRPCCLTFKRSLSAGCSPRPAPCVENQEHCCKHKPPCLPPPTCGDLPRCGNPHLVCKPFGLCAPPEPGAEVPCGKTQMICRYTSPCGHKRICSHLTPCGRPRTCEHSDHSDPCVRCSSISCETCNKKRCKLCDPTCKSCVLKRKLCKIWKCIIGCIGCGGSPVCRPLLPTSVCEINSRSCVNFHPQWCLNTICNPKSPPSLCVQLQRCCYTVMLILATCVWCPIIVFFYVMCNLLCLIF